MPYSLACKLTLGRLTHILAAGVFFSGVIKDMLCLPRPLSPPLQRITMSGSTALEYGFPSTHSTNAVSVAVYTLLVLHFDDPDISPLFNTALQALCYCYSFSIILGRVYCGMHGFLDVVVGGILGAAISLVQYVYGEAFDNYIHTGSMRDVTVILLVILVLVRTHPEPADDCPCFDDSVAFAGVIIGIEYGGWHFARSPYALSLPVPATVAFSLEGMGWLVAISRIAMGVLTIFAWRSAMKPFLLGILPPIFRVVEAFGLNLPRKYFKQASEYTKVPKQHSGDNVIPSVSEIPGLFRRRRAISIGPQSEADAYETLAYRERRRRTSLSANDKTIAIEGNSELGAYESMMGTGFDDDPSGRIMADGPAQAVQQALEEHAMFSRLQKPRVRYDVEVITKLIVYTGMPPPFSHCDLLISTPGIAWLAVEGNPILFSLIGLAV